MPAESAENEDVVEDEAVEDTDDFGDDDAEDVTEDDDKLDDEDVNVTAVSTCGDRDKITWIHTNIYHCVTQPRSRSIFCPPIRNLAAQNIGCAAGDYQLMTIRGFEFRGYLQMTSLNYSIF